jgi:uncharacterized protein YaeQ
MAPSATIYHLKIDLSDVTRGVYESLDLRIARHPSETMRYLLTRVIAYCLCYEEGITFTKGLANSDEPAIWVRDLQNNLQAWIEVGSPSADRLHKARKGCNRVIVFTQHDPALLKKTATERDIHQVASIEAFALSPEFLDELDTGTNRNTEWVMVHNDGDLLITIGDDGYSGTVEKVALI